MRSCGSSSSPTAHITFCTLTEVFRPQILIMAFPSLPRDGRFAVSADSSLRAGRKQAAGPASEGKRGRHTLQLQNSLLKTIRNNSRFSAAPAGCIRAWGAERRGPATKKARRVSPGLLGAALLNTLFWKILVTRVN